MVSARGAGLQTGERKMRKHLARAGLVLALSTDAATADELSGVITQIDREEGAITVNEETFYISESTHGSKLAKLQTGDRVVVIYLPFKVDDTYDALYIGHLEEER
jgi:hypothetical protein